MRIQAARAMPVLLPMATLAFLLLGLPHKRALDAAFEATRTTLAE